MKSIGYGAFGNFGYSEEPQWGLFNPAQSLFKSDPTLYGSLFATNKNLDEALSPERAKERARQHPGLPTEVGPRKGWKRDIHRKEVGAHNRLGGFGDDEAVRAEIAREDENKFTLSVMAIIGLIVSCTVGAIFRAHASVGKNPPAGSSLAEKKIWKEKYLSLRDDWHWFDFLLLPWYGFSGILSMIDPGAKQSDDYYKSNNKILREDVWKIEDDKRINALVRRGRKKRNRKNRKR